MKTNILPYGVICDIEGSTSYILADVWDISPELYTTDSEDRENEPLEPVRQQAEDCLIAKGFEVPDMISVSALAAKITI